MHCYSSIPQYEQRMREVRLRFLESDLIRKLTSEESFKTILTPFLIYYKALGLQTAKPIGEWVCQISERCHAMGFSDLANLLESRVVDRDEQYAANFGDLEIFVSKWNKKNNFQLRIPELLNLDMTGGVRLYQSAYEDVLYFKEPFALIAVDYEIAWLALYMNTRLVDSCAQHNRVSSRQRERWVERREAYIERLRFNAKQMKKFLDQNPDYLESFVKAGSNAIQAHTLFLEDCLGFALRLARLSFLREKGDALNTSKRVKSLMRAQSFFQDIEKNIVPNAADLPSQEKRRAPRFSLGFEVKYKLNRFGFLWKKGKLMDISRTGLSLWIEGSALRKNTVIHLKVSYPDAEKSDLTFLGKVIWSQPWNHNGSDATHSRSPRLNCHGVLFQ